MINFIDKRLFPIIREFSLLGGKSYLVGGSVRDFLISKLENTLFVMEDYDFEIFHLDPDSIRDILKKFGKVEELGANFAVYKLFLDELVLDFSIPRKESKNGHGYKGFKINIDKYLSVKEASLRRDLTINSIYFDIEKEYFIDTSGEGIKHLENKIISPRSNRFSEDPLRVLRVFQFLSRFDFKHDSLLINLTDFLYNEFSFLPKERIWNEFKKYFLNSKKYKNGIDFLLETNWIDFFPFLKYIDCNEDFENKMFQIKNSVFTIDDKIVMFLTFFKKYNTEYIFIKSCDNIGVPLKFIDRSIVFNNILGLFNKQYNISEWLIFINECAKNKISIDIILFFSYLFKENKNTIDLLVNDLQKLKFRHDGILEYKITASIIKEIDDKAIGKNLGLLLKHFYNKQIQNPFLEKDELIKL